MRHSERHIAHDPPEAVELEELAGDVRALIAEALEGAALAQANQGIGVAGTPTSLAAIDQRLDPYDPELVHGYRLSLGAIQRMCSELAAMPLAERVTVKGLHAGRAPTIVAGDGDPDRGHARVRARRDRGLRARHPLGRGARARPAPSSSQGSGAKPRTRASSQ